MAQQTGRHPPKVKVRVRLPVGASDLHGPTDRASLCEGEGPGATPGGGIYPSVVKESSRGATDSEFRVQVLAEGSTVVRPVEGRSRLYNGSASLGGATPSRRNALIGTLVKQDHTTLARSSSGCDSRRLQQQRRSAVGGQRCFWDHGETGSHDPGKVEFRVRLPVAPTRKQSQAVAQ